MKRRQFIHKTLGLSLGLNALNLACAPTQNHQKTSGQFFKTKKHRGRWMLINPKGEPFWSIGLNHVDAATLRQLNSGEIWTEKYDNSMEKWLASVRKDLTEWGFNTLGWNQELVTFNAQNKHHSRSFTYEEYQWLDMPYCHLLPFIESHQWETETRLPDIRSKGFAEWCDYVARDQCARMKDDPNLIGYFFTDCPTWVHNRADNAWKAPLFDPEKLNSTTGQKDLFDLASTYYRVITESIKRYDSNHLILGDRYEAMQPLPEAVIKAALPYVDVFSFQCFAATNTIGEKLQRWANFTNKPILLADSATWLPTKTPGWPPKEDRHINAIEYGNILETLSQNPNCIGFHLCGAYLRNKVRRYGLKDATDELDESTVAIKKINLHHQKWVKSTLN